MRIPAWNTPDYPPISGEPVLLSISGGKYPIIGRYEGDEFFGGSYFPLNSDTPLSKLGLHVNGWTALPECVQE